MISSKPISKNQTAGTVIAMMKGPKRGRNWYDTVNNPAFSITQNGAGTVALQGTNDVALRAARGDERNPVERDFLPTDGATWTDIQAETGTNAAGTWLVAYEFIRLVVVTPGGGTVTQAWCRWS